LTITDAPGRPATRFGRVLTYRRFALISLFFPPTGVPAVIFSLQASHLAKQLPRRLAGEPLAEWRYRDFGSLVSLGNYSTVGSLMGKLIGGNLFIEGVFAGLMYKSLYKMHQLALHGLTKVSLDTVARLITRRTEPHVKLH